MVTGGSRGSSDSENESWHVVEDERMEEEEEEKMPPPPRRAAIATIDRLGRSASAAADRECQRKPIADEDELLALEMEGKLHMEKLLKKRAPAHSVQQEKAALLSIAAPQRSVSQVMRDVLKGLRKRAKVFDESRTIYTRAQLLTDLLRNAMCSGGDQRLEAIRRMLNKLGYTRSQSQRRFHNAFIRACLPIIVSGQKKERDD